tara:strand:+ start:1968 stop:2360 length:393 start_codon:yes stop_codon:yes gene_type:complete
MNNQILVPVSPGEVIDKITILEIKKEFILDKDKLVNINHEFNLLMDIFNSNFSDVQGINELKSELKEINLALWKIEDDIRDCERNKKFDQVFIDLARSVYITNDKRSKVKMNINLLLNSDLIEEKSYKDY